MGSFAYAAIASTVIGLILLLYSAHKDTCDDWDDDRDNRNRGRDHHERRRHKSFHVGILLVVVGVVFMIIDEFYPNTGACKDGYNVQGFYAATPVQQVASAPVAQPVLQVPQPVFYQQPVTASLRPGEFIATAFQR